MSSGGVPHVTIKSKPEFDSYVDGDSMREVVLCFEPSELFRTTLTISKDFFVPIANDNQAVTIAPSVTSEMLKKAQEIMVEMKNNQVFRAEFDSSWYSSTRKYFRCRVNTAKNAIELHDPNISYENNTGNNKLSTMLIEALRNRIYLLKAERYNVGQAQIQHSQELLEQNCSNLAQVLHSLQSSNPERFNRIVNLLKKVFPKIQSVTVPVTSGQSQIVIWHVDPKTERKDLAVPLSESGTGVGQVLAMLYLIIYSDVSQCILIDEPQSFLHPGAIRSLLEIFYLHNRHQYIITTHSPHILSIPSSEVIHVIHDGTESKAKIIDALTTHEARLILQDLGFKLADVFGADKILWVEGATEEECFKLIIRNSKKEILWGVDILGVRSTGELQGKKAEVTYDIYTKLSNGIGIVPPAVAFIFDKELRTEREMTDLKRKSKGKVFFLPRRMYENYLLDPNAIAKTLNTSSNSENFDSNHVKLWIERNVKNKKYYANDAIITENWIVDVNGAEVLKDLFSNMSEARITFDKVRHGYLLTKSILEKDSNAFSEIQLILDQVGNSIKE